MGLREIKRTARRDLHQGMQVPALYLVNAGATPVPVGVRPHIKFGALGDLAGGEWAERLDVSPRIIFARAQVQPERNAIVSIEVDEAYRIDTTTPPDDEFVTAYVKVITPLEIARLFPLGQPVPPPGAILPTLPPPGFEWRAPGYVHTQSIAAAVWTIAHNLHVRPSVSITTMDGVELEGYVQHLSDDVLQITFGSARTGQARLV